MNKKAGRYTKSMHSCKRRPGEKRQENEDSYLDEFEQIRKTLKIRKYNLFKRKGKKKS